MTKSTITKLSDVMEITSGFAFKSEYFSENGKGLPLVRIRDVARGYSETRYDGPHDDRYVVQDGDLLVSMDGEFRVQPWAGGKALLNQRVCRLEPHPKRLSRHYLKYLIAPELKRIEDRTPFVTVKHLAAKTVLDLELPLPAVEEQKRIAAILDKADAIRRKRQQANGELEALEDSAFAFTVGTRAKGYEEWAEVTIESLAALHQGAMRTGPFGSSLLHSEFVDEGIAVLGIDNAVQNRFAWDQRRFITPAKYEEMKRYTVYPNDVIITIMGTVGRAAVIPEDIPTAITTKHIATLTLNTKIAEPEFVSQAMHRHPFIAMQMTNRGAIMNSWNLGLIKTLKVPLPPIDVQREFTKRVRQIRDLRNKLENGATEAHHLFNSLVQRAFKGEL